MKNWTSPIYAFFKPHPKIVYIDSRVAHEFRCTGRGCKFTTRRFLDKKDKSSTGNMIRHVKSCWGEEAYAAATQCGTSNDARQNVTKPLAMSGSITAAFSRVGKGKVSYSHRQHTKAETKYSYLLHLECEAADADTIWSFQGPR